MKLIIKMSGIGEGSTQALRSANEAEYLKTGNPGMQGGGTYTGSSTEPTLAQYENIFGPAGRDIKIDQQRHKRHQRWHLPDALRGHNQYLTDRVDGLITDKTDSPFTRNILPYVYLENPDQKLKWNVYSFDEGIASRVPYEAAARVLPQTKRSFAGYTIRQGLAIAMEHNFMVSAAGRENFKNQVTQLVGSIQMTNDLDVHVALLQAPSYQKHMNEKYHDNKLNTSQICRQYVDLFGIMQKIPNALDWLIEDAKNHLKTWGSSPPSFLLCNGALTTQLTMTPEKTNYVTNGPDGQKRLAQGPDLNSYRGLSIINSRKFSMDAGTAPRDLLRRRVRVAEYYRIPWHEDNVNKEFEFYDQSRDSMFRLTWNDLMSMAKLENGANDHYQAGNSYWQIAQGTDNDALNWLTNNNIGSVCMPQGGQIEYKGGSTQIYNVDCCTQDVSKHCQIDSNNSLNASQQANFPLTPAAFDEQLPTDYAIGSEMQGGLLQRDVFGNDRNDSVRFANCCRTPSVAKTVNFQNLFNEIHDHQLPSNHSCINNNVLYVVWYVVKIIEQLCQTQQIKNINLTTDQIKGQIKNAHGCDLLPGMMDLDIPYHKDFKQHLKDLKEGKTLSGAYLKEFNILTQTGPITKTEGVTTIDHDKNREDLMNKIAEGIKAQDDFGNEFIESRLLEFLQDHDTNKPGTHYDWKTAPKPLSFFIAKHAYDIWYRYNKMMIAWASDIAVAAHSSQPIDIIHQRVDELAHAFLTDLVYQQFAETCQHPDKHVTINYFAWWLENTALHVGSSDFTALFQNETMQHSPAVLLATNVHQALNAQQCYGRPNLHLQNIEPLRSEDQDTSCSSMDMNAWFTQAVAGMCFLDFDVCKMFMTEVTDKQFTADAAHMFGDSKHHKFFNSKIANSLLMLLWLQEEHYDKHVRQKAKKTAPVSSHVKKAICKAISNCIKHNTTSSDELMNALLQLKSNHIRNQSAHKVAPFNHAIAGKQQKLFALGVNDSQNWACDVDIQHIPCFLQNKFTVAHHTQNVKTHHAYGSMAGMKTKPKPKNYVSCENAASGYSSFAAQAAADKFEWLRALNDERFPDSRLDTYSYMLNLDYDNTEQAYVQQLYSDSAQFEPAAQMAAAFCESSEDECFRFFINVVAQRFFNASSRFFFNGQGLPQVFSLDHDHTSLVAYEPTNLLNLQQGKAHRQYSKSSSNPNAKTVVNRFGLHFMVGPKLAMHDESHSGGKQDILILRPNIEHEMLGIIMGRGGTQELGATFWGQTELSCYDDAQHGIWGMSYKYHARAMVTNERNLIRVFDVAFDGYNGGLDQSFVNWNDPKSINDFRQATYARDQPYNGPSMLVMALPTLQNGKVRSSWPNPIVFQQNANGNLTPDPQKDTTVTNLQENMVFHYTSCPQFCNESITAKYEQYMSRLEMHQWASIDQNSRSAGECCVGNETSSSMLAFQGSMKVYKNGAELENTQGSGHLGPSFVGVASIREGRGIQNSIGQPTMIRQI